MSALLVAGILLVCVLAPQAWACDKGTGYQVSLSDLLRTIQFFRAGAYHCEQGTEDGYAPGPGAPGCLPHRHDYAPQDWSIDISELLRSIQFFNLDSFYPCPDADPPTEDGFCGGEPPDDYVCPVTLLTPDRCFGAAGGVGVIQTHSYCSFGCVTEDAWISVAGLGPHTADCWVLYRNRCYEVAANDGPARTGTIQVGDQVYNVYQCGVEGECECIGEGEGGWSCGGEGEGYFNVP